MTSNKLTERQSITNTTTDIDSYELFVSFLKAIVSHQKLKKYVTLSPFLSKHTESTFVSFLKTEVSCYKDTNVSIYRAIQVKEKHFLVYNQYENDNMIIHT